MARKRSKDPGEGACPQCRKSVALTQTREGLFVLQTHHVTAVARFEHGGSGYDVVECSGSLGKPADIDDSKDWAWVEPDEPASPAKSVNSFQQLAESMRTAMQVTSESFILSSEQMQQAAEAVTPPSSEASPEPQNTADAPSMRTRKRQRREAARLLREALEPVLREYIEEPQSLNVTTVPDGYHRVLLHGRAEPSGFSFTISVSTSLLADAVAMNIMVRRAVDDAREQLGRRFRPTSAEFMPTRVEVNGVDITDQVRGPIEISIEPREVTPDFTGTVLVALRQAWIEERGEPPRDAEVNLTLEPGPIGSDTQTLRVEFLPDNVFVTVPFGGSVAEDQVAAEAAGRRAADSLRRALREQTGTEPCAAVNELHRCWIRGPHETCECFVCGTTWA